MDREYGSVGVLGGTRSKGATMQRMRRKMVWIERADFEGWSCSACAWIFNPSDPPTEPSLEEMKERFEAQRDKEFASHVCTAHPRAQAAKAE